MTKEWGKGREHGRIITKAVQNDIEKKNLQIFDSSFMKLQMHCDKSKIQSVSAVMHSRNVNKNGGLFKRTNKS